MPLVPPHTTCPEHMMDERVTVRDPKGDLASADHILLLDCVGETTAENNLQGFRRPFYVPMLRG